MLPPRCGFSAVYIGGMKLQRTVIYEHDICYADNQVMPASAVRNNPRLPGTCRCIWWHRGFISRSIGISGVNIDQWSKRNADTVFFACMNCAM